MANGAMLDIDMRFNVDTSDLETKTAKAMKKTSAEVESQFSDTVKYAKDAIKRVEDLRASILAGNKDISAKMLKDAEKVAKAGTSFLTNYSDVIKRSEEVTKKATTQYKAAKDTIKTKEQELNQLRDTQKHLENNLKLYQEINSLIRKQPKNREEYLTKKDTYARHIKYLEDYLAKQEEKIRRHNEKMKELSTNWMLEDLKNRKSGGKDADKDPYFKHITNTWSNKNWVQAYEQLQREKDAYEELTKYVKELDDAKAMLNAKGLTFDQASYDALTQTFEDVKSNIQATNEEVHNLKASLQQMSESGDKFQIRGASEGDINNLSRLGSEMIATGNSAKSLVEQTEQTSNATEQLSEKASQAAEVATTMSSKINTVVKVLNTLWGAVKKVVSALGEFAHAVGNVAKKLGSSLINGIRNFSKHVGEMAKNLAKSRKSSSGFFDDMGKGFKHALRNIMRYGLGVRSLYFLFRRLRSAAKEAIRVMALVVPEVNTQMSHLATNVNQLKANLSSMIQPLLRTIIPMFQRLTEVLTNASNAVAQFFAAISGQGYFYKAKAKMVDYNDELAKSSEKAKKLKDNLDGIDELNIIKPETDNDASVELNTENVEYEQVKVEDWFNKIWDALKNAWKNADFTELGDMLHDGLQNMFKKAVDWITGPMAEFAQRFASSLATLINGYVSNYLDPNYFTIMIAEFFNVIFDALNTFAEKVHWDEVGKYIVKGINDFLTHFHWQQNTEAVMRFLNGLVETMYNIVTDPNLWRNISDALLGVLRGLLTFDVSQFVSTIAATVNGIVTVFYNLVSDRKLWSDFGDKIIEGIDTAIKDIHWDKIGSTIGNAIARLAEFFCKITSQKQLWSGIGDAIVEVLNNLLAAITWEDIFNTIVNVINGLIDIIYKVVSDGTLWESIGEAFKAAFEALLHIDWEKLGKTIGELINGLVKVLSDFIGDPENWREFGRKIVEAIHAVMEAIDWTSVKETLGNLLKAFLEFIGGVTDELTPFEEFIGIVFLAIKGFLKLPLPILLLLAKGFIDFVSKIGSSGLLTKLLPAIGDGFKSVAGFIGGVWTAITTKLIPGITAFIAANPGILLVIGGIVAAIIGVIAIIKNWGEISEWLKGVWDKACDGIKKTWDGLKDFASETWDKTKKKFEDFGTNVGKTATKIKDGVSEAWEKTKEKTTEKWDGIKEFMSTTWDNIKEKTSTASTKIKDKVSEVWSKISKNHKDNLDNTEKETDNSLKKVKKSVDTSGIDTSSETISNNSSKSFKDHFAAIVDPIKTNIATTAKNIIDSLIDKNSETVANNSEKSMHNHFSLIPGIVSKFTSDAANEANKSGEFEASGTANNNSFFSALENNLLANISTLFTTGVQSVQTIFGIAGNVSSVFRGFGNAIQDSFLNAMSNLGNLVSNIFQGAANAISGIMSGITGGISSAVQNAKNTLNGLGNNISGWVQGASQAISNVGQKVGINIPHLAQGAVIPPNSEFLAVLGDQKSGTNIEAPLSTIQDAVAGVLAPYLAQIAQNTKITADKDFTVAIGDRDIAKANARGTRQLGFSIMS